MTERRHKKAVRSARKCENLLDRQRGGNKNGYKWRKSVRCRLSGRGNEIIIINAVKTHHCEQNAHDGS